MGMKIFGVIVILLSLPLAVLGTISFLMTQEFAEIMVLIGEVDKNDWSLHWQLLSAKCFGIGCIGLATGIGIVKRQRWALGALVALVVADLIAFIVLNLVGYPKYAFERMGAVELLAEVLFGVVAWLMYRAAVGAPPNKAVERDAPEEARPSP
jgi:hypothetical protein